MDSTNYYTYSSSYTSSAADAGAVAALMGVLFVIWLFIFAVVALPTIIAEWKLFTKAGKPGWASIVPIYNTIVLLQIIGRPIWWILLMFVPIVNVLVALAVCADIAKAYSKDAAFGILTFFFAPIMLLILAFSKDARYVGPVAAGTGMFSSFSAQPAAAPAAPTSAAPAAAPSDAPAPSQPETPQAPQNEDPNKTV